MNGVQCGVCQSVWLSPAAHRLVQESGGCLRCDGPLRELSAEETQRALQREREAGEPAPPEPRDIE